MFSEPVTMILRDEISSNMRVQIYKPITKMYFQFYLQSSWITEPYFGPWSPLQLIFCLLFFAFCVFSLHLLGLLDNFSSYLCLEAQLLLFIYCGTPNIRRVLATCLSSFVSLSVTLFQIILKHPISFLHNFVP